MPSVARHLRKLCILGLLASPAYAADDWQAVTFISETVGNHSNRLCMGVPDHMRGSDIGCPTYAPSLTTGGHVSITGNVSANRFIGDGSGLTNLNVQGDRITSGSHAVVANENTGSISMTTGGSTWGYFSAGWSRLANLFADTVSSTVVSATNVSATYVDTTRGGTVSGTYGYFRHISGTYLSGDGSGLYNVPASAVSGLNLDRITSGSHALIANQGTGYVSLTTGGSTWGYLSAGWSRLANLFADTVSSTQVSATNVSATYVDTTRGGTVSGTYGYFRFISGTDIHGRFTGDGSGLTGVTAAASDRIVSGSTGGTRMVAVSETGYISITQAGANSGWFDPTRGLVTLGVSATGAISGTRGYFRETVGIGTLAPVGALHIAGLSHSRSVRLSSDLGAYTELGILNNTASWFDVNPHPLTASENSTIRFFRHVSTTGVTEVIFHRGDGGGDPVAVIGNTRIALGMNGINVGIGLWGTGARLGVAGTISATDAIQVGNSSLTCGAGVAGALRYSGSKIEYCNGTAWGALIGAADAMGDRIVSGSTNIIAHQDRSLTFTTNNQQRMVIGEDGNVGIGSSVAQGRLHISTPNSTPALFLSRDGDANVSIAFASSLGDSLIDGGGSGGHLRFYTAGQQRMLLNSEGNIVIGSAYAGSSLTIAGEAQVGNSGGACNSALNAGAIRYTAGNLLFCNNANTWITLGAAGATTAASSTGAVQFNVNNQLAGDTNNFFWDNANKWLGIGTNTPSLTVHVYRPGGHHSSIMVGADAGYSAGIGLQQGHNGYRWLIRRLGSGDDMRFYNYGLGRDVAVLKYDTGHLGVGTLSPTATLQVSGSFIVSTSAQTTTPSLFVASNGSVGFGTSNPLVPFHIAKPQVGGNAIAYIGDFVNGFENNNNGIGFTIFSNGSNYIDLKTFAGGSTYFRTGSGVESGAARVAMEIAGDTGNVGFGKAAVARVDVSGTISATNAIQVGTSTLTCGAGLAGAIRYETTSNTLQICTGASGWRSLVSGTAGAGATSLAALTDVNITSLAGRDYLRYDHATSRWVNISESTVMSTTTMINAWPDAIICTNSADTSAVLIMVHSLKASDNSHYYYYPGSASYYARFNGDGSYNTGGYQTTSGPYPCQNRTISQLYASGQAFNFIGSSATGGGDALGDRITSGTHAVTVNSATGVVSLSTAGTTWGYLNSARSYLPALTSTQVSSTNVSATLLQVGTGNGAACDASRRGAMRYSTVSSTMEYCNSSAWVSMGPSATAVPSFYVHRNGVAQNGIPNQVTTAIDWTHKLFDTNNNFNLADERFTPTVPGTYLLSGNAFCNSTNWCATVLYKNGAVVQDSYNKTPNSGGVSSNASVIVHANGTTDYFEMRVFMTGTELIGGQTQTNFSGVLISMAGGGSGGGGGGGSSDLAGLTDVNLTSLAGRDYLRYDAGTSRWVNISESAVMSTTTMVSGWPDAIQCMDGIDKSTLYLSNSPNTSNLYYYFYPSGSGRSVVFSSNGSYHSTFGADATDCVVAAKSISQLYAEGRAFNFIGNSGANGDTALGDRITSGTLAVTANSATGVVSLSTAGTTWGYLNSTRSYLPALSSVQVSSTNVSATLLQVGTGNGAECDAARRGAMRYSTVSSTMEYCNSSAWVSMGPSATAVPSVHAYLSADQNHAASSYVKIAFNAKRYDTNNNFDTANGRFTPTIPGKYLVTLTALCNANSNSYCYANIYKNGSAYQTMFGMGSAFAYAGSAVTALVDMNGTTDYLEGYIYQSGTQLFGNSNYTSFYAALITMSGGGGGGGGGGSSDLAGLTDVTLTSLAGRDYLRYDADTSRWVNVPESTVMSTTTMVPGRPDTIACTSGTITRYLFLQGEMSGSTFYATGYDSGAERQYVFYDPAGAYAGQVGMDGHDCVTNAWSISQLYAQGKAFNFIGNSGENGGAALGDRITSGTLAMVANSATGVVSLSTAGTTWGYLSSGNSYLPVVLANKVSATNVSATYLQLSSPTTVLACDSGLAGAMRYTSGTMQVCNGTSWGNIGIGVPAGTISAFAAASCPSGWVEYGPARGRFLRGIDNGAGNDPGGTRAPGNVQADALQNITGTFGGSSVAFQGLGYTGAFGSGGTPGSTYRTSIEVAGGGIYDFDASRVARTANETRPKNVAVIFCSYAGYESELAPGITTLGGLSDVSVGGASVGQVLAFDGANWVASNTTATSNALGDRIISGTHAVTVNTASGVVSLSSAGTTWGYLSNGNSYLPLLSSGRVSSTNISGTLIQAGASTAACSAGLAGGIRYNAVSNTLQVCTGTTGWKSLTSGTAVSSLATLTDVNLTNLAGRDYLRYDHATSRWVNVSESTVMSTTTILSGFPDAISCSDAVGSYVLPLTQPAHSNGRTYYQFATVWIGFNTSTKAFDSHAGMAGYDCVTNAWSISQLYAQGKAFNFIGNSGENGGDALGDRITSGTHAVTVNTASGVVSLSTAGTTWGYLASGNSYLPLLTSGRVSSTNISGTLIQAGASTAACNAGLAGGIRYSAVSNTLQVCTGTTGWKSLTSGTAVSSLDALADVNITSLAGRDYLRYDAGTSRWVNVPESTVMSTTTIVPGWPDRIYCTGPSGDTVFDYYLGDTGNGTVTYRPAGSVGAYAYMAYNYSTGAQTSYDTTGGFGNYMASCNGKGIAQLYSDGQAFNFIGNSGANGGNAPGDRITSGTLPHAVVVTSATGVVSLRAGGTTWGYFGNAASYLPGLLTVGGSVSVTGNVSVTGSVQAFSYLHPSDARLKSDIATIPNAVEILDALRGTRFTWTSNGRFSYGLIAQEIEKVMPSAVQGTDSKVVDYNQFIAVLVEGWKAHHTAIKALKASNDHLEQRVQNFELTNDGLRRWNLQLRDELEAVKADNDNLRAEFTALRGEVQQLRQANAP